MRYGSSPDVLGPLWILLEVKTKDEGSLQLQMLSTDAEFCILQSYHPETKSLNTVIIKPNNTLMTIIKQLIDYILDNNHVLDRAHTQVSELHALQRRFLGKFLHET